METLRGKEKKGKKDLKKGKKKLKKGKREGGGGEGQEEEKGGK